MYENIKTVESGGLSSFFTGFLKGALVALAVTVGVFFIFALLLSYTGMPEDSIRYIAYITEAVGAFLAGIVPAKKIRRKGILTGGLCGVLYMAIIWVVSSLISDGFYFNLHVLIMLITSLASGALGGIVGVNAKNTDNNRKKK